MLGTFIDPKSIFNIAQYVTPASKIHCKKVKCAGLAQEIGFLHQIRAACSGW
jgi:hypothetical protein